MAEAQKELALGDDLFDFDGLLREAAQGKDDLGAAFDAVLATTGGAPGVELAPDAGDPFAADAALLALEPKPPLPAPTHRVRPVPPPLSSVAPEAATSPRAVRPVAAPAGALPASAPPPAPVAAPAGLALSRGLLAGVALVILLNLALFAFVARALTAVSSTVADVGEQVVRSAESAREAAAAPVVEALPVVLTAPAEPSEGPATLERARAQFELGAFERGRQTLFALLAVIDRVPADVRGDVEARARFLLADSWRLEADALARGAEAAQ